MAQGTICAFWLLGMQVHLLLVHLVVFLLIAPSSTTQAATCNAATGTTIIIEPWGRYSASGVLHEKKYLYSFGGDTRSDESNVDTTVGRRRGGVVRTNFRFHLDTNCWERLANSPTEIGYRATATLLSSSSSSTSEDDAVEDSVYVFGGANANFQAVDHLWRYSFSTDTWTELTETTTTTTNGNRPSARWRHAAVKLSDRSMFVLGGRQGNTVLSDGWIMTVNTDNNDVSWALFGADILQVYRHGMAYDAKRNVTWIFGGLDGSFQRNAQLWKLSMSNHQELTLIDDAKGTIPTPRASHAVEYVPEWDALLVWGGTCSDDSELFVYDIVQNKWCTVAPANRPNRRDAMLWALDFPHFYIATGDLICYNRGIYPIADVHVLDLEGQQQQQQQLGEETAASWNMLYEPYNERGTGDEPYCNGNNAGNCQGQPLLDDTSGQPDATCSLSSNDNIIDNNDSHSAAPTPVSKAGERSGTGLWVPTSRQAISVSAVGTIALWATQWCYDGLLL